MTLETTTQTLETPMRIIAINTKLKTEKEIHFYEKFIEDSVVINNEDYYNSKMLVDWIDTQKAISDSKWRINTTQMGLLSTSLFGKGYKVFIHFATGDIYEVKIGESRTDNHRVIQWSHDLFKLWVSGELAL
jgi:hypothetical protein